MSNFNDLGSNKIFTEKPKLPHRYSMEIGERILEARLESGFTQEELAKRIYKRRASLSDMENGKMLPDAFTLIMISDRTRKPIDYFMPEIYRLNQELAEDELGPLEKDVLTQFRRISDPHTRKLILKQIKAAADLS